MDIATQMILFATVVENGGFSAAARDLGLTPSAVSRQISALEESLNTPLFHRHARGLILTEHGEFLYNTVHEVFGKLSMAEAILQDARDSPQGVLKVTATVAFGSFWLAARIRNFVEAYPQINVRVLLDDRELDLGMREADVAVRLHKPKQPDLVQRRLMSVHIHACASRDYVAAHGMPRTIDDLDRHRRQVFREPALVTKPGMKSGRREGLGHPRQDAPREIKPASGTQGQNQIGRRRSQKREEQLQRTDTGVVRSVLRAAADLRRRRRSI